MNGPESMADERVIDCWRRSAIFSASRVGARPTRSAASRNPSGCSRLRCAGSA